MGSQQNLTGTQEERTKKHHSIVTETNSDTCWAEMSNTELAKCNGSREKESPAET